MHLQYSPYPGEPILFDDNTDINLTVQSQVSCIQFCYLFMHLWHAYLVAKMLSPAAASWLFYWSIIFDIVATCCNTVTVLFYSVVSIWALCALVKICSSRVLSCEASGNLKCTQAARGSSPTSGTGYFFQARFLWDIASYLSLNDELSVLCWYLEALFHKLYI